MSTDRSPEQTPSRFETAIYAVIASIAAAVVTFATLDSGYWPLPLGVGAAVGVGIDRLRRHMGCQRDLNHITIVLLTGIAGCFVATTTILATRSAGRGELQLKVLSPPSTDISVPEKLEGVSGIVSSIPPGDVIWLMVKQVGDKRTYLMAEPCAVTSDKRWYCPPTYLGGSKPSYQHYKILVQILDGKTQQQVIREWGEMRQSGGNALSYTAPVGETVASIEVHRDGPP
jgi:hypothetical protein